ncbi:MAG: chromosome segregation protein SMC [Clostridia bacterium]|nr:chromosome segregation protein SMC [Clostridia bacterium]
MYLKSLELQGFKSFPDKTKLTFEGGATVIVGPNGSGKSNISDAMRWVLGEVSSKSIRGTKMEDIIFGGADSRRPMGYAEVSVTFDNTDMFGRLDCPYDEVTVTRRYYRSGESEYFINRRACRLKDIYELFMNTGVGRDGYSIIGQGKIADIISRKSDERRSIFEDASGIAKYRHKKSETERKLAATEDNMTRINDVFTEVAAQVGPLEREAAKAKKALELLETKKQVDIQLWLYDTEKLREDVARCEENFSHAQFDLNTVEESIKDLEAQNDRLFEIAQSGKSESENLLTEIRRQTEINHTLDSEYRVGETNILHTRELIASAVGTCESTEKSVASEQESVRARHERIGTLKGELEKKNLDHSQASADRKAAADEADALGFDIDRALADIHVINADIADVNARISFIDNSRNTDTDKNTAMQNEIAEYEAQNDKLSSQIAMVKKTVEEYDGVTNESREAADRLTAELSELYARRQEDNDTLSALGLRRDSAQQRIDNFKAMEEQLEGYSGSVRFVMKKYAEGAITDKYGAPCGKIYGPLSKLISVEDRYITAIETALGANLQHIVVEDETVAKAAMFALKKAEAGRATFFPCSSMKGQTVTPEMRDASGYPGYIAVADELVKCDGKFSQILSGLLGRTVIFDTIDNATAMAKDLRFKVKAVTLDGQQINVGGSFTGGSVKHKGNILGRAGEIKRLEEEVVGMEKSMASLNSSLFELSSRIEELEDDRDSCEQKISLIKVMRDSEAARLEQLSAKLEANATLTEKLKEDYAAQLRAREQFEEDRERLSVRKTELEAQVSEISAARAEMDIRRSAALDRKDELDRLMTDIYIGITEVRKDIETEERMIEEAGVRMDGYAALLCEQKKNIEELEEKIKVYETQRAENRELYEEGARMLAELNEKRSKVEAGNTEFERKLNEVNARVREKMQQKENVIKEYTRFENRLSNLRAEQDKLATKLWDEHELTRADAVQLGYPALDSATRAEAAAKQTECRNKLRVIGNVDLDAVNKYKDVKARYDYMEGQIKDLGAARDDLLDIIGKLEGEMETSFVEAFTKINENFNRVFGELFGGGTAQLSLTDPEHVLESGIEIKAAPPGKIIKNMVQLSGGEQSFIAIALFFAILQVNPTPFCILDEIEAALDEVNVARFAEYIKRYSSGTQFIMITHRRGTMEAANRLYGVTMPERGISKVLELDINDISKKKGDDWDGIFG